MGGDDWKRWIDQLADAGVLAPGFRTLNYTYIGSELTWPIYWNGTLRSRQGRSRPQGRSDPGQARPGRGPRGGAESRGHASEFGHSGGAALWHGAVQGHEAARPRTKAASSRSTACSGRGLARMSQLTRRMRIRVDDWELSPEVQAEVARRWPLLTTETLGELADLPEYQSQFLRLFGFGIDGVDYAQDVDPRRACPAHCYGLSPPRSSPRAGTPAAPRSGRCSGRTTAATAPS